jgi:hypothetical protein
MLLMSLSRTTGRAYRQRRSALTATCNKKMAGLESMQATALLEVPACKDASPHLAH